MSRHALFVPLLLLAGMAAAADPAPAPAPAPAEPAKEGAKELDGMSILGNQEAPKALVLVPWKSSELGDALGVAPLLDDSRGPVDRDVFLRALGYWEIRSESARQVAAPAVPSARRSKS